MKYEIQDRDQKSDRLNDLLYQIKVIKHRGIQSATDLLNLKRFSHEAAMLFVELWLIDDDAFADLLVEMNRENFDRLSLDSLQILEEKEMYEHCALIRDRRIDANVYYLIKDKLVK